MLGGTRQQGPLDTVFDTRLQRKTAVRRDIGKLRLGMTRPGYFRMGDKGWHFSLLPILSIAWDKKRWRP